MLHSGGRVETGRQYSKSRKTTEKREISVKSSFAAEATDTMLQRESTIVGQQLGIPSQFFAE